MDRRARGSELDFVLQTSMFPPTSVLRALVVPFVLQATTLKMWTLNAAVLSTSTSIPMSALTVLPARSEPLETIFRALTPCAWQASALHLQILRKKGAMARFIASTVVLSVAPRARAAARHATRAT